MRNKLLQQELPEIKKETDVLLRDRPDRRLLAKVPDQAGLRTNADRRRLKKDAAPGDMAGFIESQTRGRRYLIDYDVSLRYLSAGKNVSCPVKGIDISTTGMLLEVPPEVGQDLRQAEKISLKFAIAPGTMPEGYEMKVHMAAKFIRLSESPDGKTQCGVEFAQSLAQYASRRKSWYLLPAAAFLLFVITACILLLRAESILYFKFNQTLYLYSIIAATFLLTRYLFASFYRPVPIDKDFTPGVSIIVPCFNEETWIQKNGCRLHESGLSQR